MRLLMICRGFSGGGAESVARSWRDGLSQFSTVGLTTVTYDTREDGSLFVGGMSGHRPRILQLARRVGYVARQVKPDVVIAVATYANLVTLLAQRRHCSAPVVATEHTLPTLMLRSEGVGGHVKRSLARYLYPGAGAVTACSHAALADVITNYRVSGDRAFFLPNPVLDLGAWVPESPRARSLHLGFVGRLSSAKEPARLVEVAQSLTGRGWPTRLTFVGDGPLAADVARAARTAGIDATFLGWRLDPALAAKEAGVECLVLTSPFEGFANVLVEAAAVGLATVAPSGALGVADAVLPYNRGVLSRSRSATDMADAVVLAVGRPDSTWLNRYSVAESSNQLLEICRAVAQAAGPRGPS